MNKFLLQQQAGQLHGEVRVTVVTVSGGPTLLPADPLPGRKDFLLYNPHATDTVYLGGSNVTSTSGIPVIPTGSFALQAGRAEVYATASGSNVDVSVMEVA